MIRRIRSSRWLADTLISRVGLLLVLLLSSPWMLATAPAQAAEVTDISASVMDARAEGYLDQLLNEINARRAAAGAPPVVYAGTDANLAVTQYLNDLTPMMMAMNTCFHGNGNPVAPGWDYVRSIGFGAQARGEVLACPDNNGFWTAPKIADGWWNSPIHHQSLYSDRAVNAIACGTYGPLNGGRAYQTIACVTYHV